MSINMVDNRTILCYYITIKWTQPLECLGFNYDMEKCDEFINFDIERKLVEISNLIALSCSRRMTPFWKIVIVKSLLISEI